MSVVAYFGFMSLNVQLNPRKLFWLQHREIPIWKKKNPTFEDGDVKCHDFSDFIASNSSGRYRDGGGNNKFML